MQEITITGRLGRDAETRETTSGLRFVTMAVASDTFVRGAKKTTWFDVTIFNTERYEKILPHMKKGHSVFVIGELDASEYKGNDGNNHTRLSVTADRIGFVQGDSQNNAQTQTNATQAVTESTSAPNTEVPDEIPVVAKKPKTVSVEKPSTSQDTNDDELPF